MLEATEVKMFVTSSDEGNFSLRIVDNGQPFKSQHKLRGSRASPTCACACRADRRAYFLGATRSGGTIFTLTKAATVNARNS